MSVAELQGMGDEVRRVSAQNAHLYLWTTNNYLPSALVMMRLWGYNYRTVISWFKGELVAPDAFQPDRMGLGQYYRGLTEHCLFGVRGMVPYRTRPDGKRAQGRTAVFARRGEHSKKPEAMRAMIEDVSAGPYLELFARGQQPGWTCWGNEAVSATLGQQLGLREEIA